MNAAVVKLAEAAAGGGRTARGAQAPLKVLGNHPRTEAEIKLMEGRYGPYVTDGTTNATLPKSIEKDQLTLEEAASLIDARAAAAPATKKKKAPAKKPAAKKATAKAAAAKDGEAKAAPVKKAPAKKAPAKKAAPKKKAAAE
jgi:DNA topoisomerase-1